MKFIAIMAALLSFQVFAEEIKIMEIGAREMFGYDRIETEFIFDKETLLAGVNVKMVPALFNEWLPQDNELAITNLSFDPESGSINLHSLDKTVQCATIGKKKNGQFSKAIKMTNACKFENRYREFVKREGIHDVKVQVLDVFLTF